MSDTEKLEGDLLALSGSLKVVFNNFTCSGTGYDFSLGDNPRRLAIYVLYGDGGAEFTVNPAGAGPGLDWYYAITGVPVRFNIGDSPGLLNQTWNFGGDANLKICVVEVTA